MLLQTSCNRTSVPLDPLVVVCGVHSFDDVRACMPTMLEPSKMHTKPSVPPAVIILGDDDHMCARSTLADLSRMHLGDTALLVSAS